MKTYLLVDDDGNIKPAHSISAGLDYPGTGPEHAYLHTLGRATYEAISDKEALEAFHVLSEKEGIIPALESAHAIGYALKIVSQLDKDKIVVINVSGRGDKDVQTVLSMTP